MNFDIPEDKPKRITKIKFTVFNSFILVSNARGVFTRVSFECRLPSVPDRHERQAGQALRCIVGNTSKVNRI